MANAFVATSKHSKNICVRRHEPFCLDAQSRSPKNCINAPGQPVIDFIAGAGDTLSFGLTNWVRDQMGTNDFVNQSAGTYAAGEAGGVALSIGIGGAAGAEAATANAGKVRLALSFL